MDRMTRKEMKQLIESGSEPSVSVYMPYTATGDTTGKNAIRLKNLLRKADDLLEARGMRRSERDSFLEPAYKVLESIRESTRAADGLAMFVTDTGCSTYALPISFEELVVDGTEPHIKPLVPYFHPQGEYHLLAFSYDRARLYHGNRYSLEELEAQEMPQGISDTLKYDESEKQLQSHPSEGEAYHGHDVAHEDDQSRLRRYCEHIDRSVRAAIGGATSPLVVVAERQLQAMYTDVTGHQGPVISGLDRNSDTLKRTELLDAGWSAVKERFEHDREEALRQCKEAYAKHGGERSVEEILEGSFAGRVETLFVDPAESLWGRFERRESLIEAHAQHRPGDDDLIDLATAQAYMHGAKVYPAGRDEIPGPAGLAAVFRF